jgi:Domain of unknown function (DUF4149)
MLNVVARVLAGLWTGSLWTICGVVAPTLFATLEDRRLAGDLAGRFFELAAWLGVGFALPLLSIVWMSDAFKPKRVLLVLIALTAYAPVQVQLGIVSSMQAARAAGDSPGVAFAHTLASGLFFAACVAALGVLWILNRPAE